MKKIYTWVVTTLLLVTACSDEVINQQPVQKPVQDELIGTAIQFSPFVEDFKETRVASSINHNGGFNSNDMMYIYRQYYDASSQTWVYKNPPGSIYKYTDINNGQTGLFDKTSWKVYSGKTFMFKDDSYTNLDTNTQYDGVHSYKKKLAESDSLTWESGNTVRFRAWAISRLNNDLSDKIDETTKQPTGEQNTINYPDYMVCDWVTVSGPTLSIPMAFRHLGSRITFQPRGLNQFVKIEISTDPADYMREDNAETNGQDEADKHPATSDDSSVLTAEQCAANVKAVYEQMCWPAGVDMNTLALQTCSPDEKTKYKFGDTALNTEFIKATDTDGKYTNVKHAQFNAYGDSRWALITIPYNMATEEPLVLPPYTRFRVWLRDVNSGDGDKETDYNGVWPESSENRYHIFRLSDVLSTSYKDEVKDGNLIPNNDSHPFKNGLTFKSGNSYTFQVGYLYDQFTVWAADDFSWQDIDLGAVPSVDEKFSPSDTQEKYHWWTQAFEDAKNATGTFNLSFNLSTIQEVQEFADLVNGNFTYQPELYKAPIYDPTDKKTITGYNWYKVDRTGTTPQYIPATKQELIDEGYIFYQKYTPSIADKDATFEEDYLDGPYSFYDTQLRRRWTVTLANDIDMKDTKLPHPIGNSTTPFAGYFNGNGHTLKNVFMNESKLFGYAKDGSIRNLILESTHPLSITGTCENERILGCAVYAPSTQATLANATLGFCYFVGCIHVGEATNKSPLVNNAGGSGFQMYGCMQAASLPDNMSGGTALANITTQENFFSKLDEKLELDVPEVSVWQNVSCNYYDTEKWEGAQAFTLPGSVTWPGSEPFHRRQYIRGADTHILCAKNDYLVDAKTLWFSDKMSPSKRKEIYGVAPWKAMNFGIQQYNNTIASFEDYNKCGMHYESESAAGYSHRYPVLKNAGPTSSQYLNVLKEFN